MALTTNKYRNKKIKNAYGTFDSIKEYRRFLYLSAAQKKGLISELARQKKFTLIPSQRDVYGRVVERECSYRADFCYRKDGRLIVEDVKSDITRKNHEYIIKRKLMLFIMKIKINEV